MTSPSFDLSKLTLLGCSGISSIILLSLSYGFEFVTAVGIGLIVGTELKVSSNPKGFLDGLKGGPKGPQTPVEGYGGGCSPPRGCSSSVSPPLDNSFETFPQSGGVGLGGFVVSRSDLTPNGVVRLQSTAPSVLKVPKDLYPVLGLSREGLRELWLEGEVYDVTRPLLKVNFLIAPFFLSSGSLRVPRLSG